MTPLHYVNVRWRLSYKYDGDFNNRAIILRKYINHARDIGQLTGTASNDKFMYSIGIDKMTGN